MSRFVRWRYRSDWLVVTTLALAITISPSLAAKPGTPGPSCEAVISGTGASALVNGLASDSGPRPTGIVSAQLDSDSVGLVCTGCTPSPLTRPVRSLRFSIGLAPSTTGGRGRVTVMDATGKTCRVGASFTPIAAGPVTDQPILIDTVQIAKLFVVEGNAPTSGTAVVASTPPSQKDAACLPSCFEFPTGSLVLTVDSPIEGFTTVAHDIGPSDVRLLSKHPTDACPWADISDSLSPLVFDPRLGGGGTWSRIQFAAGQLSSACSVTEAIDADGDGFFLGGTTPVEVADCNDANRNVNPAATEVCNGIDDNCDRSLDEIGCGSLQVDTVLHTVGNDGSLLSSVPLPGTEVRIYSDEPGTCADSIGVVPQNYLAIYGDGSFASPGCVARSSGLSDENGQVSFSVAPGKYVAIGRPPDPHSDTRIGATIGNVTDGGTASHELQLILDLDGNEVPSRTQ